MIDKLMPLLTNASTLNIKQLDIVSLEKENGVVIQMTSDDPDGVKMAGIFAKTFEGLADVLKAQGIKIDYSHVKDNE